LNKRLYFSSDGHIGLGGLDVFYVVDKDEGEWSSPENIGYPINSTSDDFGVIFNEEGTCGFFASVSNDCTGETYTTDSEGKIIIDQKLNICCNFEGSFEGYNNNTKEACTENVCHWKA